MKSLQVLIPLAWALIAFGVPAFADEGRGPRTTDAPALLQSQARRLHFYYTLELCPDSGHRSVAAAFMPARDYVSMDELLTVLKEADPQAAIIIDPQQSSVVHIVDPCEVAAAKGDPLAVQLSKFSFLGRLGDLPSAVGSELGVDVHCGNFAISSSFGGSSAVLSTVKVSLDQATARSILTDAAIGAVSKGHYGCLWQSVTQKNTKGYYAYSVTFP